VTTARSQRRSLLDAIAHRPRRRLLFLLALGFAPFAVYAQGSGLFVNGTVADADDMNAVFAAYQAALDQLETAAGGALTLTNQGCPAGEFARGIDANGDLVCAQPPGFGGDPTVVGAALPASNWTTTIAVPACPAGQLVEVVGTRSLDGVNDCGYIGQQTSPFSTVVYLGIGPVGIGTSIGGCAPILVASGTAFGTTSNCECFALCR